MCRSRGAVRDGFADEVNNRCQALVSCKASIKDMSASLKDIEVLAKSHDRQVVLISAVLAGLPVSPFRLLGASNAQTGQQLADRGKRTAQEGIGRDKFLQPAGARLICSSAGGHILACSICGDLCFRSHSTRIAGCW